MKEDSLGLNHLLSLSARCHTVSPRSSARSSGHLRIAPLKSSGGMPKCFWYQAASAALFPLHLRKTPPIPVIFANLASSSLGRLTSADQRLAKGKGDERDRCTPLLDGPMPTSRATKPNVYL